MNDIDFERASLLMDIQQKVASISPMNSSILGEASLELQQINEACRENALERADERRKEEANREAETQAKLREDNPLEDAGATTDDDSEPVDVVDQTEVDPNTPVPGLRRAPAPTLRRP